MQRNKMQQLNFQNQCPKTGTYNEWSFPNIELACILEFLRVNEFIIKVFDNEFLARLFRNETEIQMSFDI